LTPRRPGRAGTVLGLALLAVPALAMPALAMPALAMPALAATAPTGPPIGEVISVAPQAAGIAITFGARRGTTPVSLDGARYTVTAIPTDGTAQPLARGVSATPSGPVTSAPVKQTVLLLIDRSQSMVRPGSGGRSRIEEARAAAHAYLDKVPAVAEVGLVTFGDTARVLVPPTGDRARLSAAIDAIRADARHTLLRDGVAAALDQLPPGGGAVVVLTDGQDEGSTLSAAAVTKRVSKAGAHVQGVFTGTEPAYRTALAQLLGQQNVAGAGQSPTAFFQERARAITLQTTLPITVPAGLRGRQAEVEVTADLDGVAYTGRQLTLLGTATTHPQAVRPKETVPRPGQRLTAVPTTVLLGALVAVFLALSVFVAGATGALSPKKDEHGEVLRRLSLYSVSGRAPQQIVVREQATRLGDHPLARGAVNLVGQLTRSSHLEHVLDARLEAAGLPLRTVEWMLLQIGVAVLTSLVFLAASGGSPAALFLGLALGLAVPWLFLSITRSRRENAFLAQLPDALQLIAGSLKAGYSLPQAMDAVVREVTPPISVEFNRALVESRLGMSPEDALDGIAARTGSRDFSWIVMAIRIQRDVGGNLAELLTTVGDTLRERERLRRQVRALSAEGKLSGYVLGALPVLFTVYLLLAQPEYLNTLFTDPVGVILLGLGVILLVIGGFWMSRLVKVKV
jgi:tight adherence protein B